MAGGVGQDGIYKIESSVGGPRPRGFRGAARKKVTATGPVVINSGVYMLMSTLYQSICHSDLVNDQKQKALHNVSRATPDEGDILRVLFDIPECQRFVGEILRGAYVHISDKGARYDDWKQLPTARSRPSSHSSVGDQYHVDGPLAHTILFGKFGIGTWVQLERHPIYDLVNLIGHGVDYVKYKIGGKNQGPYGSSAHSEKHSPLIINTKLGYFPIYDPENPAFKAARRNLKPEIKPFKFK